MELLVHHGLATEDVTGEQSMGPSTMQEPPDDNNGSEEQSAGEEEASDAEGDTESEHSVSPPQLPDETCTALHGITDPEEVAFLHEALLNTDNVDCFVAGEQEEAMFWPLERLIFAVMEHFSLLLQGRWHPRFEPFDEVGNIQENEALSQKFDAFVQVTAVAPMYSKCT
jgi:hypothetical protein